MSRSMSATALQALYAQETDQVFLVLLELDHADLSAPIRVVRNTQSVTSNGNLYSAYPFDITLPDDVEGAVTEARLTIDNVDRQIVVAIRTISSPPTVTLSIVLASDLDTVEAGPWEFTLRNASYNVNAITGTLRYEESLQVEVPGDTFNPQEFGGLF